MPKINSQALLKMAAHAEKRGVYMNNWFTENVFINESNSLEDIGTDECGTVGCLLGTYLFAEQYNLDFVTTSDVNDCRDDTGPALPASDNIINAHLGLTCSENKWLFLWSGPNNCASRDIAEDPNMRHHRVFSRRYMSSGDLEDVTTEQAIRRLRKFIYYKLKKQEMIEAWNERQHTRGAVCENEAPVVQLSDPNEPQPCL